MRYRIEKLQTLAERILERGGSSAGEAQMVARHLIEADMAGHPSHGVGLLPLYVQHLQSKLVVPNSELRLLRDAGAILTYDGQSGFGRPAGEAAVKAGIARCHELGLAAIALGNAHHLGRIGAYAEIGIQAGFISIHFVNVLGHDPFVAPHRGIEARLSTNPVCIGIPGSESNPAILLDMATSAIAVGKARVAMNKGEPLPPGKVIDHKGLPTTDPSVMYKEPFGALLPLGEHKGYALAFLCDLLAGSLSNAGTIEPSTPRTGAIFNCMLSIFLDPSRFGGASRLRTDVDAMVEYVKSATPVDKRFPVMVPGEPEEKSRQECRKQGIPLDGNTVEGIVQAAMQMGISENQARSLLSEQV